MTRLKTIVLSGFAMADLTAGQASAQTTTFVDFPTDPFQQQDKIWGGWLSAPGALPTPFSTQITTRSQIFPGEDLHAITVTASLNSGNTYDFS